MARTYDENTCLDMQVLAMETGFVMHELGYFIAEYNLPARPLANLLEVSLQTVYFYADPTREQRPSLVVEQKATDLLERLKRLAESGLLELSGTPTQRAQHLTNLLVVDASTQ